MVFFLMMLRSFLLYCLLSVFVTTTLASIFALSLLLALLVTNHIAMNRQPVVMISEDVFDEHEVRTITDVSTEIICKYQNSDWPVWIEVENDTHFMFDGQHNKTYDGIVILDEDTIVLPPDIRYIRITSENLPALATMLGVTVDQLEIRDGVLT